MNPHDNLTLFDYIVENMENGSITITLPKPIETRIVSIYPLLISDEYLNSYPIKVNEPIKKLFDQYKDCFDMENLNIKIIFQVFSIRTIIEKNFFTIILEIYNPSMKTLYNTNIISIKNISTIKNISKNQEFQSRVF